MPARERRRLLEEFGADGAGEGGREGAESGTVGGEDLGSVSGGVRGNEGLTSDWESTISRQMLSSSSACSEGGGGASLSAAWRISMRSWRRVAVLEALSRT